MNVYVPRPGSGIRRTIIAGSGIVGRPEVAGTVLIDFEGNLHNASNISTYADRVNHAWGRQSVNYPTVARLLVRETDVILVGSFDPDWARVTINDDAIGVVRDWIGAEPTGDQLLTDSARELIALTQAPEVEVRFWAKNGMPHSLRERAERVGIL